MLLRNMCFNVYDLLFLLIISQKPLLFSTCHCALKYPQIFFTVSAETLNVF